MPHASTHTIAPEMQACIDACTECHIICLATVPHCLDRGGSHADPSHIGLLLDCADMCQTSANFMVRGSGLHRRTCAACAEVCQACADDCERLDPSDEQMRRCADSCRRCAQSCERMARPT